MTWVRARSNEQIEQRISEILEATARLYEENRFEEITFVMIAKEAGFTRSNLYRYFETKEDIFLELLKYDMIAWRNDVSANFPTQGESIHAFAEKWVSIFLEHKRMLKLQTILYTLIEKNATLEALVDFKKSLMEEVGFYVEAVTKALPFPSPEATVEFLYASLALMNGTYPLMDLTDKQKEAMQIAGMDVSPLEETKSMLIRSTESLLRGLTEETV